jgi:hypothetical protein
MVVALGAAACSGPRAPLEVGSKEIAADILIGESPDALPSRPPGANPGSFAFPGFLEPPIPRLEPGVVPPPQFARDCPIADPLDAALQVARASAPRPPKERPYAFRNTGWFQAGEGPRVDYPRVTERRVDDVATDGANFEFDVAVDLADETTTTTYRVVNEAPTPERGIYIIRVVTERSDGADVFVPQTPILLMPFPPPELGSNLEDELAELTGEEYRSSGTDPLTQTTLVLEAKVAGKTRVDACGEWVDAFDVEVISGRIVGPGKQIEFTGSYAIAPQYGGLIVEDDIRLGGLDAFEPVKSRNRARINRVPAEP